MKLRGPLGFSPWSSLRTSKKNLFLFSFFFFFLKFRTKRHDSPTTIRRTLRNEKKRRSAFYFILFNFLPLFLGFIFGADSYRRTDQVHVVHGRPGPNKF